MNLFDWKVLDFHLDLESAVSLFQTQKIGDSTKNLSDSTNGDFQEILFLTFNRNE